MPQPTGVRTLSRSFVLPGPLHKSTRPRVEPEDRERFESSEIRTQRRPSRGNMDIFSSREKRRSLHLPGRSSSPPTAKKGSPPRPSPRDAPSKAAKLTIEMESPPLVFHGTTNHSTGALLSGQLKVNVTESEITLKAFTMTLNARLITRKPVVKDCPDCTTKDTELFKWTFLTELKKCPKGISSFPFSYLLPGHLPATSRTDLGRVDYILSAKAITDQSETLTVDHALHVQRALMPGVDKSSVRIFPPTNLTATVGLPNIIHPIGSFPVQLRLSGVTENIKSGNKEVRRQWRIRKMNWRIDENNRIISAACAKHAAKVGGEGKGILHEDSRILGNEELKSGWKSDFDVAGGSIEAEFVAGIRPNAHPVCDVDSATGLSSSHNFVLEIIVAEEQTMLTKQGKCVATPTGAARVLRMQFKLPVTERAGMGISWDEEMPPMYEDVPDSPPGYTRMDDYDGDVARLPPGLNEYEELEAMGSCRNINT